MSWMKLSIVIFLIGIKTFSANLSSESELILENLKVVRAEQPNVFESFLVLASEDFKSRVTVTCSDGFGPLQSVIVANFSDDSNKINTRTFSGSDFYCYGAGMDLTAKLSEGQMVSMRIELNAEISPKKVNSLTVNPSSGGNPIISSNSSTKWFER